MLAPTQLHANGPTFSRLVAGVMTWGVWGHDLSASAMSTLIDECLDAGITTFDHADIYGHYTTEATFGEALRASPSRRQQLQLVSKCGIKLVCEQRPDHQLKSYAVTQDYIIRSTEQSLTNLGTDYLDLLLIHRPSPLLRAEEVAEAVAKLKQAGKVRYFGVSNFTPTQFAYLNSVTPLVTNQVEASITHTEPLFDGTFDQCLQHNVKPMAWSPLGGVFKNTNEQTRRILACLEEVGKHYGSPGADVLLLAWLLHHPAGIVPVVGTARAARLRTATQAVHLKMTDEHWFQILEAARGEEVA
ncbi:MAG: aldo/keto reductase [Bacteroidota bacterium]